MRLGHRDFPEHASFIITEQGKEKLSSSGIDAKSRILFALESGGSGDMDDIASRSGISKGQVERLLPVLVKQGVVQPLVGGAGSMDSNL